LALTGVLQGGTTTVRVWLAGSTTARALTGAIVAPLLLLFFPPPATTAAQRREE
jgi:hypothetical protein